MRKERIALINDFSTLIDRFVDLHDTLEKKGVDCSAEMERLRDRLLIHSKLLQTLAIECAPPVTKILQ